MIGKLLIVSALFKKPFVTSEVIFTTKGTVDFSTSGDLKKLQQISPTLRNQNFRKQMSQIQKAGRNEYLG
jgi:hypothetical protein